METGETSGGDSAVVGMEHYRSYPDLGDSMRKWFEARSELDEVFKAAREDVGAQIDGEGDETGARAKSYPLLEKYAELTTPLANAAQLLLDDLSNPELAPAVVLNLASLNVRHNLTCHDPGEHGHDAEFMQLLGALEKALIRDLAELSVDIVAERIEEREKAKLIKEAELKAQQESPEESPDRPGWLDRIRTLVAGAIEAFKPVPSRMEQQRATILELVDRLRAAREPGVASKKPASVELAANSTATDVKEALAS